MKDAPKVTLYRRSLMMWEDACRRLGMARKALRDSKKDTVDPLNTAKADLRYWKKEEKAANKRVADLEREIVRSLWHNVFHDGRALFFRTPFPRARR